MKILFQTLVVFFSISIYAQGQNTIQIGNTTLTERSLLTGLGIAWDIVWGPDDHIWFTEREGKVKRLDPVSGNVIIVLDATSLVFNGNGTIEPGMLGMLFHPNWDSNQQIYIVYTYGNSGVIKERLSRFEWNGTELANEEIILDDIPARGIHNGSRLILLPDNTILMTTGDIGNQSNSQDMSSLNGKTLRINLDGSIPDDNPFPNSYIYSFGHRNSQGLFLGPNDIIYSSEFGPNSSDEINIIEEARNYGWPNVLGICNTGSEISFCNDNNVREPVHEWSNTPSPNGLLVYNHPAIPEWQNKLMVAMLGGISLKQPRVSVFDISEDGLELSNETKYFETFGRVRDICVNPNTGAIYFATNGPEYFSTSGPNRIIEYYNDDFVVDVKNVFDKNQYLKVYPNPVVEIINIEVSENFIGKKLDFISFATGALVMQKVVSQTTEILNISDLPTGQYYISIINDNGLITKVFVKD